MISTLISIATLAVPFYIVGKWRKRPILSFITATIVFITLSIMHIVINIIQTMALYGEGDPQLMAGLISEGLTKAILTIILLLPLLALFQLFMRKRYKKQLAKQNTPEVFE